MSSTLVVPQGISYVAGALLSTSFLLVWQGLTVNRTRKAAGIPYPQLYAEKSEAAASPAAMKFNCAQRAHQNTLENIPTIYLTSLLTSLKYPKIAAVAVGIWTVSRIAYSRGYLTGNPDKRINPIGLSGSLVTVGLIGSSAFAVYQLIVEGI
ncbi:membrane-associated proteins in eicosanoid and glutathione metabolism [Dendrothele bispora CBS 962.96]|uniref:Membrane-associated proteins in eicosanoid and glutathione metabolism n=1 Tax=Dendrothele bispora (strain CBS 962.96) TaxID=1314807 RepID=A0A4S8MW99_DENBC|nr:membrane-associated proteins in eicosanoid and glutathione metabolism [Dendrothele bispora CBS 962.96]